MNKNILLFLLLANYTFAIAQDLKLMTYNMRLDIAADGDNAWDFRKDFFIKQLKNYTPDIFGTQEGLPNQIDFIEQELSDYAFIGIGRDGAEKEGEYCAVFYKKEKFELLKSNTFWLSKTSEKVSKGWDAAYIRICTYGLFKDKKTGKLFWIINTHLDNEGEKARRKGMRLVCKKIKKINTEKYPIVLMGDWNAEPETKFIRRLSRKFIDAKMADANISQKENGTFNAFKTDVPATRRIDYVFLSKNDFEIKNYQVPKEMKNGKYASDHFPVIVGATLVLAQ